jgi:plasmid stabilization system protein ParE
MMRIRWSTNAERDLQEIYDYLAARSLRAASGIAERIKRRVEATASTPLLAPRVGRGSTRMLVVSRTPYLVFYQVKDDELLVEAVFHASRRRPARWRRRH